MKAKKHLGQHFLKSQSALLKIRDAADILADDIVLEIGPGTGALTEILLQSIAPSFANATAGKGKVVAIEKDPELIPILQEKFAAQIASGKLELLEKDVMEFDPAVMEFYKEHSYKLVANIPYYITGAIIEKFLSTSCQPEAMVLLIQKEVADRIVAKNKKESILSTAVKAYGIPKIIAKVPPGAFVPPPTVDSAIIAITDISRDFFLDTADHTGCDETLFFAVMKSVFGKKRKQIGGSLSEFLQGDKTTALYALHQAGIDPKTRPEDISLQTWKKLIQQLQS